jgi:hypothetical protein
MFYGIFAGKSEYGPWHKKLIQNNTIHKIQNWTDRNAYQIWPKNLVTKAQMDLRKLSVRITIQLVQDHIK